jgi:hypothetical protein
MYEACLRLFTVTDITVMAAAVADTLLIGEKER